MRQHKQYRVHWTHAATRDLRSIIDYVAVSHPLNARKILCAVKATARKLESLPSRGRVIPELKEYGVLIYQELLCPPWRIMYRIVDKAVYVVALIDSRRDVEDILFARFIN